MTKDPIHMRTGPPFYRYLRNLLAAAAALATLSTCATRPTVLPSRDTRPNIVLIFADDLGYGDLGTYGHPTIRTPHLDRMAEQGMKFTQFCALSSVCSPSRAALMTGRYPMRTGVFRVLSPTSEGGLPPSEITLAQALKNTGYATACIGKWHLGHREPYLPTRRGFDHYFGIPYSNDMSPATSFAPPERTRDYPPTPLIRDTQVIEQEPDQALLTHRYTREAIRFLRDTQRGRGPHTPFFLYLPHTMPHVPLAASASFHGRSARGPYGDAVEELDWSVGQILGELTALGIDEQTLVIFTSDNGPALMFDQDG
ncbi:MAG: sulfatase-like hydrolase/transferase, partial [Phycisphaerae bacterium]|nr:sulfatase-like hydrolase/transferase [Phycisphaerae bacterium]